MGLAGRFGIGKRCSRKLRDEVDGQKLFQMHFDRAAEIEKAEEINAAADAVNFNSPECLTKEVLDFLRELE